MKKVNERRCSVVGIKKEKKSEKVVVVVVVVDSLVDSVFLANFSNTSFLIGR